MNKKQRARIAQNSTVDQMVLQIEQLTKRVEELTTETLLVKANRDNFEQLWQSSDREVHSLEYHNEFLLSEVRRLNKLTELLYADLEKQNANHKR